LELLGDCSAQPLASAAGYQDDTNITRQEISPAGRCDPARRGTFRSP
jgi:hypothetical protein